MLIRMRLSPPCVGIEVRAGLARLLDPPCHPATALSRATASPVEDSPVRHRTKKNVHRAGRVSGGLLNPSGGARDRPRNKYVLAQSENELNHNFARGNKIRLTHFQKILARVKDSASRGEPFLKLKLNT